MYAYRLRNENTGHTIMQQNFTGRTPLAIAVGKIIASDLAIFPKTQYTVEIKEHEVRNMDYDKLFK